MNNLGVIFHTGLRFKNDALEIRISGFFSLQASQALGEIIPMNCLEVLIHANVTSIGLVSVIFCLMITIYNLLTVFKPSTMHVQRPLLVIGIMIRR